MPLDKLLLGLLEQPFGPYLDETILSQKCRFVPTKRLLLENFMLAYNDEPTGFDLIDFDGDLVPSNARHLAPIPSRAPVLFRGVLSILARSHLSEKGIQYLSRDFRNRASTFVLNGVPSAKHNRDIGLEDLFALKAKQRDVSESENLQIKVIIQGRVNSMASFMRSDVVPNGLLIHTGNDDKNRFRYYEVVSMDVETYKLSRTFLFRHHTLRALRDILMDYGDGVPVNKRTPSWFLDHYILSYAHPPHSKWHRINSLEDVESSDEDSGGSQNQMSIPRPDDAQTTTPRHLRTVHRNEIWSIFASHSEWIFSLIQKHKDLKDKVDAPTWGTFLMHVPRLRQKALLDAGTDGKWGLRDEQKGSYQLSKADSADVLPNYQPEAQPTTSMDQKKKKKQKQKSPSIHPVIPSNNSTSMTASSLQPLTPLSSEDQMEHIYDSDFSQASLSSTSSVDSIAPIDPELICLIPREMLKPPRLPIDLIWHCPVGGGSCTYSINLCAPSDDNLRLIRAVMPMPHDAIIFLLSKDWKSNDEQIFTIFYEMVNAHWANHLKELDIKYIRQGDAVKSFTVQGVLRTLLAKLLQSTFEWIHPQRHRQWPPKKWKNRRTREESPEF